MICVSTTAQRMVWAVVSAATLLACAPDKSIGTVTRIDPALDAIISPRAKITELADGFIWAEGPVWVTNGNYLLFTDVPENIIYRWSEADGLSEFLNPSGLPAEQVPFMGSPGANGLIMGEEFNHIYIANHSKRAIIALDLRGKGETVLTESYDGKKFSSPNDLVLSKSGKIYFTDPPFGLKDADSSPYKEQAQNGVYRLDPDGFTYLLIGDIDRPNGVDLSPDENTLYLAVSDRQNPRVMAYDLSADGEASNPRVFYDFAASRGNTEGVPDGLDIAADGTLFLTGPGGVHIVTPDGKLLGIIDPGSRVANVTIGNAGTMLYLTAHTKLARIEIIAP